MLRKVLAVSILGFFFLTSRYGQTFSLGREICPLLEYLWVSLGRVGVSR